MHGGRNKYTTTSSGRILNPILWSIFSPFIEQKMEVIQAYKSQFFDSISKAPQTPISSKNFLDSVRYRAQNLGRLSGVEAAEGFTVERVPVIQSFSNLF